MAPALYLRHRRRSRLVLAGLVVSFYRIAAAAVGADNNNNNGAFSAPQPMVKADDARDENESRAKAAHDAKMKRSMELVASALRHHHYSSNSRLLERQQQQQLLENSISIGEQPPSQQNQQHDDTSSSTNEIDRTRRKTSRDRQQRRRQQQQLKQTQHNQQTNTDVNTSSSPSSRRNLIVGGSEAEFGRFPYAVSLQLEKILTDTESDASGGVDIADLPTCGGTLIAMDVVLTAAHCGYEEFLMPTTTTTTTDDTYKEDGSSSSSTATIDIGSTPQQVFVGADVGAYNIATSDFFVENMLFEKLVLHPDYSGFQGGAVSLQHDVMLVKLYGASDQPVVRLHNPRLANEEYGHRDPEIDEDLVVIGWGDIDPQYGENHTTLASVMQAATLSYVPNDVCEASKGYSVTQTYSSSSEVTATGYFEYEGTITDDMMCALGDNLQDACQGDSGGGLLRLGADFTTDVQMGIVSWGLQCGDQDFPGVYSRVGAHYDWIEATVCELSDSPPSYFNCVPKPYPPGNPYDPIVQLTISIRFDSYMMETGWVLESIPDFRNIAFRPFGTYYEGLASIDENNTMREEVQVLAGRFYMLSILDEFADGFCCKQGHGYFRVDSSLDASPVVDSTPGILWTAYSLRRAFYVSRPDNTDPPDFITVVVTLGMGADPSQLLLVVVENVKFEAVLLYSIQPFNTLTDSRTEAAASDSLAFKVPVFGAEFYRQRYNVIVYDGNYDGAYKASFEVYLGSPVDKNLILAQSGDYGYDSYVSRSFVLFEEQGDGPGDLPKSSGMASVTTWKQNFGIMCSIMLCLVTS